MKVSKETIFVAAKGFCMGTADVVPGVSGGTVALITGIYDTLIESVSSVNKVFVGHLVKFRIKKALAHINFNFLAPLMLGILTAIVTMAKAMHFFMQYYTVFTWSLFFGLILASIIFIAKQVEDLVTPKNIGGIIAGTLIGYACVSLIPVETPDTLLMVFLSGCIGICAMILPGISGSFILLILGKYLYITSAVKDPLAPGNYLIIGCFAIGCLVGLLSFSKLLNYLLKHFHNLMMCILIGFMLGSLKKIWPWKEITNSKMVNGKLKVLEDVVVWPETMNTETFLAFGIMLFGFAMVFVIESLTKKKES